MRNSPPPCAFCGYQATIKPNLRRHLIEMCQSFCMHPQWAAQYLLSTPRTTKEEVTTLQATLRAKFAALDPRTTKRREGMRKCSLCGGLLEDMDHYRLHLVQDEYLHCHSYKWFKAVKSLATDYKGSARLARVRPAVLVRLVLRRIQATGEDIGEPDDRLKRDPGYALYYVKHLPDQPSNSGTTKMQLRGSKATAAAKYAASQGNQKRSPGKPESANAVAGSLSSCQSLIDVLLSSNILLWYAWHCIQTIVQDIRSTAELTLLRPLDNICDDDIQEVLRLGIIPQEAFEEMDEKWFEDARFQAAVARFGDTTDAELRKAAQMALDWNAAVQRTMLSLADYIVAHAAQQQWHDVDSNRTFDWRDGNASLFQRSSSYQQTVLQCLTVHWSSWQDLFSDFEVYLKSVPSKLQRRVRVLQEEYDREIAPLRVRRITRG